jgi:hypothetical protein
MAATLQEILLTPDARPKVIADCQNLIEKGVSDGSGISGTAVKIAYKTVNALAPNHVVHIVDALLPQIVDKLEPYWADYATSGGSQFGDYLASRGDEVSEALLSVTDERAKSSSQVVIVKAYGSVRSSAAKHVTAALPDVGQIVVKYAS